MKNLEQQPMSEDKKSYIDNKDKLAALKAKPVEDLSMEEFKALKEAKQANEGLIDKAKEEAGAEDAERNAYDEAKAEDAERKVYDEAKAEDVARTEAKLAEVRERIKRGGKTESGSAEVSAGIKGTKTETGSVEESTWRSKTWQEIRQSAEDAVTPEDRAKYQSEQLEAWHALKDLEGASSEQLEAAKKDAERNIQLFEDSLKKPMEGPDSTHPVFDTPEKQARREEARSETLKELEGWKKRLEAINEVMNKGKSESGSVEEGVELTAEDIIEDVGGLEKMEKKAGESLDAFNERRRKIAQEIAKKMGYKNTTTIYDQISSIDYEIGEAAKKKDGSYDRLIKEIGKKREELISLNAYSGNF